MKINSDAKEKIDQLRFHLRRDDGAIVYLNGKEVIRSNMPSGQVDFQTPAMTTLGGSSESRFVTYNVSPEYLAKDSTNLIAVEIHQAHPSSSDLYLDMEVKGYSQSEIPPRDFYREGFSAYNEGDLARAAELLSQLSDSHPRYAQTMAFLAHRIYCDGLGRAKDGLPFIKKAYQIAPQDRNVIQAYLRTHVLSGVLFDAEDITRQRVTEVADKHKFLVSKPSLGRSPRLDRADLEKDLDYLEHILINCFAYLEIRDVDYKAALDAIRLSLDDETPINRFQLQIAKLISLFCDGHARIAAHESQYLTSGYAPFLAEDYQGRVFLFDGDKKDFVVRDFPYVRAIDGRPIEEWMRVAGYVVVKESAQWHRRHALANLRYVNYIRSELDLPLKPTMELEMESENGENRHTMRVSIRSQLPARLVRESRSIRRIGNVGYLPISAMTSDPAFLRKLDRWMNRFRDTNGLIIDLRGNSGGSKHILYRLFPYFVKHDAPLRVLEMSVFRKPMDLPKPAEGGFMRSDMSGQPVTSSRWKNDSQRQNIRDFISSYRTEWPLPNGKFSEWHVMALDASDNPSAFYYDKPLIILQDSGSFSAADIFLGAFEDHPNTTLIGQPSGGGNGWQEVFLLPNSGVRVVLCQSAKFRPNGKLYDGVGIQPDILIEATPQDVFGKSDTVLDAALKRLND